MPSLPPGTVELDLNACPSPRSSLGTKVPRSLCFLNPAGDHSLSDLSHVSFRQAWPFPLLGKLACPSEGNSAEVPLIRHPCVLLHLCTRVTYPHLLHLPIPSPALGRRQNRLIWSTGHCGLWEGGMPTSRCPRLLSFAHPLGTLRKEAAL